MSHVQEMLQQQGQHLGLLQGPMSPPSTHHQALYLLLAGALLKGMVHLIYKLYLKAVILCIKFNGAIGFF